MSVSECQSTWPLFLTSSCSPYSSRVVSQSTMKYLCKPRKAPTYPPLKPRPHSRSPAPPFTGVPRGGSEGRDGCAGEPSCLPEKQPGHHSDGHGPGSQDAGEERAWKKCGRRSLRTLHAAPRARCHGISDRDGSLAARTLSVLPFPGSPEPRPAKVPTSQERALPVGGGARSGASALSAPGLLLWERLRGPPALASTPHSALGARWPSSRSPPLLPGICGFASPAGKFIHSHVCRPVAVASSCSSRLRPASKCYSVHCSWVEITSSWSF